MRKRRGGRARGRRGPGGESRGGFGARCCWAAANQKMIDIGYFGDGDVWWLCLTLSPNFLIRRARVGRPRPWGHLQYTVPEEGARPQLGAVITLTVTVSSGTWSSKGWLLKGRSSPTAMHNRALQRHVGRAGGGFGGAWNRRTRQKLKGTWN